ncbi:MULTISPECIES: LysR family transcriptional regulator [unclassified Bordetella]|uniref:LysR family transcriptional regulator n=1 Tax=unclassified Bordetella TaxID=2630031 RepID=UPI0013232885|nr:MULTISPECIES: LysR family transcriptional regulator [unclassified Bordetella]MVW71321.1 LysR family transcriptional regulator [Bordetella sp. 15P40C-2]MVW79453.1 LysR family transcriptional regulator [Bordetella sp. 02P26C-1]
MKTRFSPSLLTWLRCFEAVARCGSFTRAAQELHITQGAVSQQIKQLEGWLDVALLKRLPRDIALTSDGERLRQVVSDAFHGMDAVIDEIRHRRVVAPMEMICAPSFAMRWLMPRMGEFFRCHPDIPLRIQAEVQSLDYTAPSGKNVDAIISFVPEQAAPGTSAKVLDEWIFPVASPDFLAMHPEIQRPQDLRPGILLHDDAAWQGAPAHVEWRTWLGHAGVALPDLHQGQRFNLSQLAVGAAMAGQGIAIGRAAVVFEDVLAGRLVDVFGLFAPSPASYFFATHHQASAPIAALLEWILSEANAFRQRRDQHFAQAAAANARCASPQLRMMGSGL